MTVAFVALYGDGSYLLVDNSCPYLLVDDGNGSLLTVALVDLMIPMKSIPFDDCCRPPC